VIIHADILDWAATYTGEPFHAAFLDAPYELREIDGRELDRILGNMEYETGKKGFMGRAWDGTGSVFRAVFWEAIARHLYPGGFIVVFGGTLNDDLISLAMRRAGLRKYHKALAWCNLSGFPKATAIAPQLDRAAGAAPTVVGTRKHAPKFAAKDFGYREKDNGYNSRERESFDLTTATTDAARAWEGHRYGLQALKPAADPILIFQKPYDGKPVRSIATTGSGALNIAGGRVGVERDRTTPRSDALHADSFSLGTNWSGKVDETEREGRWPANLALVHHPLCNGTCHEQCPVRVLGEQSGTSSSSDHVRHNEEHKSVAKGRDKPHNTSGLQDTGTAARMFLNASWMYERLEEAAPVHYTPKASTAERDAGLGSFAATTVDDGRQVQIDNAYQRGETERLNTHTCIKPIALCKWLATLLLPPVEYAPRRLLVPCCGSGSEVIGGFLAGFEDVVGIEKEAEYVAIARARLDWWQTAARRLMTTEPDVILAMEEMAGERTLFDGLDTD
jgi:hypothetical protein